MHFPRRKEVESSNKLAGHLETKGGLLHNYGSGIIGCTLKNGDLELADISVYTSSTKTCAKPNSFGNNSLPTHKERLWVCVCITCMPIRYTVYTKTGEKEGLLGRHIGSQMCTSTVWQSFMQGKMHFRYIALEADGWLGTRPPKSLSI